MKAIELKPIRIELKISQLEVATALGIHHSNYSNFEKGKYEYQNQNEYIKKTLNYFVMVYGQKIEKLDSISLELLTKKDNLIQKSMAL